MLNLSEEEQRTFAEWFANLDTDKQAKLNFKNVTQFLCAYHLNDDDLDKIFDICGAKRLDHFGRSQFYIALKLVALVQNGYELSLDNLNIPNLPLPRKFLNNSNSFDQDKSTKTHLNSIDFDSYSSISSTTNSSSSFHDNKLPPPVSSRTKLKIKSPSQICTFCNKSLITPSSTSIGQEQAKNLKTFVLICPNCKHLNQNSPNEPPNTVDQKNASDLTSSSDNSRCSSTEIYETIDTSLAFENLKPWMIPTQNYVGGLDDTDESKHCLLNDEEEQVDSNRICLNINNYDQFDSSYYFNPSSSSQTVDDSDDDVWSMSDDQIKYYHGKFLELLPSKHETRLAGTGVKPFFEKSRLSLADLKQIWTLSDLDADGHLSLIEFSIAMHLIVLRRNQVQLPDQLPLSLSALKIYQLLLRNQLLPEVDQSSNSFHSSSLAKNYDSTSGNVSNINVSTTAANLSVGQSNPSSFRKSFASISTNDPTIKEIIINSPNNREWTKFNNSPFTTNPNGKSRQVEDDYNQHHLNNQSNNLQSTVSDVNCLMTPANFTDKIELDPTIIHPLAHPLAVKGNHLNSQQFAYPINSQTNKDSVNRVYKNSSATVLNPPIFARPRGHARSSSLDLTRSIGRNANTNVHHHTQGAFVNYREHIQQLTHPNKSTHHTNGAIKKDKQYFLKQLRAKYTLPQQYTNHGPPATVQSLKEQIFHFERVNDELIYELANALEQLSVYQQRNS